MSNQTGGGTSMEEQQSPLTYEIIKATVAGERWVIAHYDSYIEELTIVKEKQPDGL